MKTRKTLTTLVPLKIFLTGLVVCAVTAFILVRIVYTSSLNQTFTLPDTVVSQSAVQLCSPYANLCFTRPASWTRSSILHIEGTASDTIEINPPTGTILEFAKSSNSTTTICDKTVYKDCIIKVSEVIPTKNNLNVVTGMIIDSPDANCTDACPEAKFSPFVLLISDNDFKKYKLEDGTSTFDAFNPQVLVENGKNVFLQVTPGKESNIDAANAWQNGTEAKTAQQILANAQVYNK